MRNYWICWLFLSLSVIAALAVIIVPICSHNADNITTSPENLRNWEAVSQVEGGTSNLEVISISHYPPRLVGWDRKVIITLTTKASGGIAYLYIRQERGDIGLQYPFEIQKNTMKFEIDMGSDNITGMASDNLTNICNAELYILGSDRNMASAKPGVLPHKFEVTFVDNYLSMFGVLATVTAVVVALLSLWAQLYARLANRKYERSKKLATLNLFWTYIAISIALLGLICFLSAFSPSIRVTQYNIMPLYFVGWGLLVASIAMIVLSVFKSIIAVFIKGIFRGASAFDPSFVVSDTRFESYYKWSFAVLIFLALSLCILLLWLIAYEYRYFILKFTLIMIVSIAYIWISIRYSR